MVEDVQYSETVFKRTLSMEVWKLVGKREGYHICFCSFNKYYFLGLWYLRTVLNMMTLTLFITFLCRALVGAGVEGWGGKPLFFT